MIYLTEIEEIILFVLRKWVIMKQMRKMLFIRDSVLNCFVHKNNVMEMIPWHLFYRVTMVTKFCNKILGVIFIHQNQNISFYWFPVCYRNFTFYLDSFFKSKVQQLLLLTFNSFLPKPSKMPWVNVSLILYQTKPSLVHWQPWLGLTEDSRTTD